MKIEVLKGKSGKWHWRIMAKNGRILANSETYSSKRKALQTAKRVAGLLKCFVVTE